MKRLIVNADDLGAHQRASKGIIKTFKKGIVTQTSLIINLKIHTNYGVKLAKNCPSLPVGLHLNLTYGKPILSSKEIPSIFRANPNFNISRPEEIHRFVAKIKPEEALKEFKAQISLFNKMMGKLPDHIDSHHYIHGHPKVFYLFLKLAKKHNFPVRLPLYETIKGSPVVNEDLKRELIKSKIKTTDYIIPNLKGDNRNEKGFIKTFSSLKDGIGEIIVHPINPKKGKEPDFFEQQSKIMVSQKIKDTLKKNNIKLISYRDL